MNENMSEKKDDKLEGKQPLSLWRRILLWLILLAVVLLGLLMVASYLMGKQVGAEIVKIHEAGEPVGFSDLEGGFIQSSPAEDAASYYTEVLVKMPPKAAERMGRINLSYRQNMLTLSASEFPGELRKNVTESLVPLQPVMEKLDKGAELPLSSFDIGIKQGIQVCQERLQRVRTAIFLSSLRTLDLVMRGESDAAANSAISTLKMLRILDTYPTLALSTFRATSVSLACDDIRLLLQRCRPSEESLAKLQKVLSEAIPASILEKTFLAERVYQIENARNLIPGDITSQFLDEQVPDLPERLSKPSAFLMRLRLRRKSTQYFCDMAWLIAAARCPWPEPLDIIDSGASARKSRRLVSTGSAFVRWTAKTLVIARCTLLAVAIERCHRAHDELPASLDDVLPIYVASIPSDPFTGDKLLYHRDEEGYVVYSVGVDRQDNGGLVEPKSGETSPQDRGIRINFGKSE